MSDRLPSIIDDLSPSLGELFAQIGARTGDDHGISRDAYGEAETAAGDLLIAYARKHGLEAGYDRVGNVNVVSAARSGAVPELIIGSHIDSVPLGGNYDGLAGVIAGIGTLIALREASLASHQNVRVVGFRGEESPWFGTAYLGSKMFTGRMLEAEAKSLRRFDTGKTLSDHLESIGVPVSSLNGKPIIPFDRILAYLELHIEQGPLLVNLDEPIAIATAIRGNIRYPFAKCFGQYAHSAGIPRRFRQDALIATAKLVTFADECWKTEIESGHDDLVFTCGIFRTDPHENSMTKVPGEITFSLNIGGTDSVVMRRMHDRIVDKAAALAEEHRVRFEFGKRVGTEPINLNERISGVLSCSCAAIRRDPPLLPTVGHDAAMFAQSSVPTGMILIRNENGSHNPNEKMDMSDFTEGLKVLASSANEIVASSAG